MSYKVLARKWRPQRFSDMLGQEPVLRALVNALDSGRLHHAYLFTGMRGVGKTTIARIFAKCLNCEVRGVSSTPCGECATCRDIEAGRFMDLIEVDAASRTKVEETRELLENVPYAPASGRYKVYLIDEVHMFSSSSFNALLKTLEEPPEHVKFLLATTDPQKVPVTVLSRCLQFNLRRMAPDRLADYLAGILEAEGIEAERPGLDLIARASEGSVRDSLSLVEQAAAYGQGAVRATDVESMLGRVSIERLLGLVDALAAGDVPALFARTDALAEYAPDFAELLGELLGLMHRLAMLQSVPGSVDPSMAGHAMLERLAAAVAPEEVQLWYQIGLHARRDMPFAPDARESFDMALLRMHAFRPQEAGPGSGRTPAAPVARADAQPSDPPAAMLAAALSPESVPASAPAEASRPPAGSLPVIGGARAGPGATPASETARSASAHPANARAANAHPANARPANAAAAHGAPHPHVLPVRGATDVDRLHVAKGGSLQALSATPWSEIVGGLGLSGMPRQLAAHAALVGVEGARVALRLGTEHEYLNTPRFVGRLREALSAWAGTEVQLDLGTADAAADAPLETPALLERKHEAARLDDARAAIEADPKLAWLAEQLNGEVDPTSVQPLAD